MQSEVSLSSPPSVPLLRPTVRSNPYLLQDVFRILFLTEPDVTVQRTVWVRTTSVAYRHYSRSTALLVPDNTYTVQLTASVSIIRLTLNALPAFAYRTCGTIVNINKMKQMLKPPVHNNTSCKAEQIGLYPTKGHSFLCTR